MEVYDLKDSRYIRGRDAGIPLRQTKQYFYIISKAITIYGK